MIKTGFSGFLRLCVCVKPAHGAADLLSHLMSVENEVRAPLGRTCCVSFKTHSQSKAKHRGITRETVDAADDAMDCQHAVQLCVTAHAYSYIFAILIFRSVGSD